MKFATELKKTASALIGVVIEVLVGDKIPTSSYIRMAIGIAIMFLGFYIDHDVAGPLLVGFGAGLTVDGSLQVPFIASRLGA